MNWRKGKSQRLHRNIGVALVYYTNFTYEFYTLLEPTYYFYGVSRQSRPARPILQSTRNAARTLAYCSNNFMSDWTRISNEVSIHSQERVRGISYNLCIWNRVGPGTSLCSHGACPAHVPATAADLGMRPCHTPCHWNPHLSPPGQGNRRHWCAESLRHFSPSRNLPVEAIVTVH